MLDDTDQRILDLLATRGPLKSSEIAEAVGFSRQAAHLRLRRLMEAGHVLREGAARATRYRLVEDRHDRRYGLDGLAEERVFEQLLRDLPELGELESSGQTLVSYVVTELVNNAIDHSGGTSVWVRAVLRGDTLRLEIEDDGVGALEHVREALDLSSELVAIQEISKGKTTTAPDAHSGEGLFFVSKAVDFFRLESGELAWLVDNLREDTAIEQLPARREGTLAAVEIDLKDPRDLAALFDEYTEDYEFSKTRTVIKLFAYGVRFISRSEAKRLTSGLEKFREVVLDFHGVDAVGQGFADEVFRVWQNAHPEVRLTPIHMVPPVDLMVERARRARQRP